MKYAAVGLVLLCACATSDTGGEADAMTGADADTTPAPDADTTPAPDAGDSARCADGQVATSIAGNGDVTCASIDEATAVAVRSRCAVYLGQRDNCDGCTDPPTRWSSSGPLGCSPGSGDGNACVSATLDDPTTPVTLATVDLDGDVNDDDKLYTTLHCIAAPRDLRPAPCAPGWAIAARSNGTWLCAPISESAIAYVGGHCATYLGWQDSCDGCTTPPGKWGFANDAGCTSGAGADNTCVSAMLDGAAVNLIGINTDGDVDGNDKIHVGLACEAAAPTTSTATEACPEGDFVVATNGDDSFECASPAATFAAYVGDHCSLFLGWRDSCDNCTQPPFKWGRVTSSGCENGAGADNTCTSMTLGSTTVEMFGLNTDGDVNGDDTLYVGVRCTP